MSFKEILLDTSLSGENVKRLGLPIVYFETTRGDWPVRDYIEKLSEKERSKVKALVEHLSKNRILTEPHAKKIVGYPGLFELRPGRHRIFYCYSENQIVLLHAFPKKSNKTPRQEIEIAFSRKK